MSWHTVVLILAALFAVTAFILSVMAWHLARKSADQPRRLAGNESLRLELRRFELERELIRQPLLAALFDEFEDLRCRDRVTPVALDAFARMHLLLFESATNLIDGFGDASDAASSDSARAWNAYARRTLAGSRIIQDVLERSGAEYGDALRQALRRSAEPAEAPPRTGMRERP